MVGGSHEDVDLVVSMLGSVLEDNLLENACTEACADTVEPADKVQPRTADEVRPCLSADEVRPCPSADEVRPCLSPDEARPCLRRTSSDLAFRRTRSGRGPALPFGGRVGPA
eukprot:1550881-Pleurochrysis_carterae.AAC.2